MINFNLDGFNSGSKRLFQEESLIDERLVAIVQIVYVDDTSDISENILSTAIGRMVGGGAIGSSFNIGGFNRISFNASDEPYRQFDESSNIDETVNGLIGTNKVISDSSRIEERLLVSASHSIILLQESDINEKLEHNAFYLNAFVMNESELLEMINRSIHAGKFMYGMSEPKERIVNSSHVGKIMYYLDVDMTEEVLANVHVGKIIWDDHELYEIINNFIMVALRRYQTFFIDAEMPPGSEMRINSDNFTVFMSHMGQTINLRSRFSGDWIHFDRGTRRLRLSNQGSQILRGDVVYSDRWL